MIKKTLTISFSPVLITCVKKFTVFTMLRRLGLDNSNNGSELLLVIKPYTVAKARINITNKKRRGGDLYYFKKTFNIY